MKVINIPYTLPVQGCKYVNFFGLFKVGNISDFVKFREVLFLVLEFIQFLISKNFIKRRSRLVCVSGHRCIAWSVFN